MAVCLFLIFLNTWIISQTQNEMSFDNFKKLKSEEKTYDSFKLLSVEDQKKFLFGKDDTGAFYLDSKEKTRIFQDYLEKDKDKLKQLMISEVNKRISLDSKGNALKFKDGSVPKIRDFSTDDSGKKLVFDGNKIGMKDKNGKFTAFIDFENIPKQTTSISFGKIKDEKGNEIGDGFSLTYDTLRDKSGKEVKVNVGIGTIGYDKNGNIILMDENGNSLFNPKIDNLLSKKLSSLEEQIVSLAKDSKTVANDKIDAIAKKKIEIAQAKAKKATGEGVWGSFASSLTGRVGSVVGDIKTKVPKETVAKVIDTLSGYANGVIGAVKAGADSLDMMFSESNELRPLNGNGIGEITIMPGTNGNIVDASITSGGAFAQGNRFYGQPTILSPDLKISSSGEAAQLSFDKNGDVVSSLNLESMGYRKNSYGTWELDSIIRTSRTTPTALFFDGTKHSEYANRIEYDGTTLVANGDGYKYMQVENKLQKVSVANSGNGEASYLVNGNYGIMFSGDKTYSTTSTFNPTYGITSIINENDPSKEWRIKMNDDGTMSMYNLNAKADEQVKPVAVVKPWWVVSLGTYAETSVSGLTLKNIEDGTYTGSSNDVVAALRFPKGVSAETVAATISNQVNSQIYSASKMVGGDDNLGVLLDIGDSIINSEKGQAFLQRVGVDQTKYSDLMYLTRHLDQVDSVIGAIASANKDEFDFVTRTSSSSEKISKGSEIQFTNQGVFIDGKSLTFYNNKGEKIQVDNSIFRVLTSSIAQNNIPTTTVDVRKGVDMYLSKRPQRISLSSRWNFK